METAAVLALGPCSTLFCARCVVTTVFEREWGMLQQAVTTEDFAYSACISAWTPPLSSRMSVGRIEEYVTLFFFKSSLMHTDLSWMTLFCHRH